MFGNSLSISSITCTCGPLRNVPEQMPITIDARVRELADKYLQNKSDNDAITIGSALFLTTVPLMLDTGVPGFAFGVVYGLIGFSISKTMSYVNQPSENKRAVFLIDEYYTQNINATDKDILHYVSKEWKKFEKQACNKCFF